MIIGDCHGCCVERGCHKYAFLFARDDETLNLTRVLV